MKFGKSLSEKVRDDWKEFAVDYKGMKKVLPKDDDIYIPSYEDEEKVSDDSKEECCALSTSPEALYPEYWSLYQQSLSAVTNFYNQKSSWAQTRYKSLQNKVEKYRLAKLPGSTLSPAFTVDDLKAQVAEFKTELEYVRQFLAINYTAFSKILKKYDKRTLSSLRDKKLEELMRDKPFFDGTTLEPFLQNAKNLLVIIDGIDGRPRTTSTTSTRSIGARSPGANDGSVCPDDSSVFTSCSMTRGEASFIYEQAKKILDKIETSPFFTKYKAKAVPRFLPEEIEQGLVLGEGEFSVVREIKAFDVDELCPICVIHRFKDSSDVRMEASEPSNQLNNRDGGKKKEVSVEVTTHAKALMKTKDSFIMSIKADDVSDLDMESFQDDHEEEDNEAVASRGFMKHHCFRDGSARYAVKQLKSTLTGSKRVDGAIDLSIEAKFLSVLSHPNIIRLCGIGGARGHHRSFLVLDRLYDTLDVKIDYWRQKEDEYKGFFGFTKHKSQLELLWNERLLAGFDIGRAMKYLHGHNIIYRDLKPENIGFDVYGNAKLFDFGLAKELRIEDKVDKDQYNASGRTGTRRYMAPEVVLCKHYGKPADVFSFSILLWEILALKQPFKGFDYEKHAKLVVKRGKRPEVKKEWATLIRSVIKRGWDNDPSKRPTFDQICDSLAGEFSDLDQGLSRTQRFLHRDSSEARLFRTLSSSI